MTTITKITDRAGLLKRANQEFCTQAKDSCYIGAVVTDDGSILLRHTNGEGRRLLQFSQDFGWKESWVAEYVA